MSAPTDAATPLPAPTVPLPPQPEGVAWPTLTWATGEQASGDPDRLEAAIDAAFRRNPSPELALSLAFVAVQGGRIVAERYSRSTRSTSTLISWSTAKSMTHAALGILLRDGRVDLDQRPVAPEWADGADPRQAIGLRDLLAMRSGLLFNEDYVDADTSHCLEMLYGAGAHDVAGYAAALPLEHPVDTVWNYSSGTTNIVSRLIGSIVGGGREGMERFLRDELFDPIGMSSAEPRFDEAGTWVGSSYLYATARDFARFGYLYLRDGVWDGRRILPEGWVDDARTPTSVDPESAYYGHQWWVAGDERGQFSANGYEGQRIVIVPSLDLVLVRLGKSPIEHAPALDAWLSEVVASFEPN